MPNNSMLLEESQSKAEEARVNSDPATFFASLDE